MEKNNHLKLTINEDFKSDEARENDLVDSKKVAMWRKKLRSGQYSPNQDDVLKALAQDLGILKED